MRRRPAALLVAAVLAGPAAFAAAAPAAPATPAAVAEHRPVEAVRRQSGVVRDGDCPIAAAEVTLYRAGEGERGRPTVLARGRSGADGRFELGYRSSADPDAVLYLVADAPADAPGVAPAGQGGRGPVRLAAVLGAPDAFPQAVVDEQTTVAAAYAMAQFTEQSRISGTRPGVRNAAAVSHNLADVAGGGTARFLATAPNGDQTSTLQAFNGLANLLAGCVSGRTCGELLRAAARPGRPEPTDTFQALVEIARAPGVRVQELFALSTVRPLFAPALPAAPTAWTLALRYQGDGHELDGPGNIAFDAQGDAWVVNNYRFGADPHASVCGGRALLRFTPDGRTVPGSPYRGGGVYGAGFGIAFDPTGDVWAGNFGFQGSGCPLDASTRYRSVSQFAPDGTARSPRTGWQVGGIVQPQGMAADRDGTVWVANCGGRSVTRIPHGDPARAQNLTAGDGLVKPFGITVDPGGQVWVTGHGSDNVVALAPDGTPVRAVTGGGLKKPMGAAADSLGNVWVANSGIVPLPCENDGTAQSLADAVSGLRAPGEGASVTRVNPDGSTPAQPFTNGGLFVPWGIAVDGDDNVWVANFGGQRLAQLCGARAGACPTGVQPGEPISPAATGYTSDGLLRNTGVQIDPSGNVWLANNWQTVPLQTNPGGHELVVFVGLAAPVRTPLIGAPQRP
ncbi:sugar lactone lactonase YvrE [Kitasatospora sp. MAP12-15]|uniref:NHL repeat-containing protein n=1 Tax=unclassified Kitasatospora TaxID=2633591 RepID=UPI002476D06E|nr:NHL repeat-containing protein [Kitasatospora sp. MAP12-44]MDH6115267.1 sugar lactone lactonase YvrE [Kitasatospora sp. MAP12-44]